MTKQRSIGVIIFGWIFIIFSLIGLLSLAKGPCGSAGRICPLPASGSTASQILLSPIWTATNFVMVFAGLIAGIFILKLKEWARKLVIILQVLSVIVGLTTIVPAVNMIRSGEFKALMEKGLEPEKVQIKERYKLEYQEQALKDQEKALDMTSKSMCMFIFLGFFLGIGWNAFIIFYFTRPKVKEQFAFEITNQTENSEQ